MPLINETASGSMRQDSLTGQDDAEAAGLWIAWAKAHVEGLNPLNSRLAIPEATEPTPEALKPFLDGWSPHSPGSSPRPR